jgi:hypothetical protein
MISNLLWKKQEKLEIIYENKIHLGEVKILNIFSIFLVWTFLRTTQSGILSHLTVLFLMSFPFFAIRLLRPFFNSYSLYPLPILASGHATGPPTPIPPHIHRHTQQYLYTHGRPSRRFSNPCFLPPPYRQPQGDIHTHPWPGGGSFLGKKSSPFGGIRTH